MGRLLRERLLLTLVVIWATVTLAFFALRVVPGDALANQLMQSGASTQIIAEARARLGLDDPLLTQYAAYLAGLIRGDLGYSLLAHQPVTHILVEQLGATIELTLAALLVALSLGLTLGITEALAWPHWPGRVAGLASVLALSTPIYWTGTLAIFFFSAQLGWLPATGAGSLSHLILPAAVLGFHTAGSIARITRTSLRETLEADFIRTARAKGLRNRSILMGHALRAALPAIVSVVALQIGFLLGGTVITEMLFARRGLGQLLHSAILDQDYPVVQGVVILSAITYSVVGMLADVMTGLLDPRLSRAAQV